MYDGGFNLVCLMEDSIVREEHLGSVHEPVRKERGQILMNDMFDARRAVMECRLD
jgi:hypothetical protein